MSNAGLPGKPQNSSGSGEDIPAALRDTPVAAPKRGVRVIFLVVGGVLGFVVIAALSGWIFSMTASRQAQKTQSTPTPTNPANTPESDQSANKTDEVLGHLTYAEAPESDLVSIPGNPRLRLRKSAAEEFNKMVRDAQRAGVNIVLISAFRTIKEQEQLFFGIGSQRNQTPAQRAALSAPPGYSEHHTGYTVDIGDANVPATNLSVNFEKTKAFVWMTENAAKYRFEMSFPRNNSQGVSYEPWHWRFVGDRDSLETFYKARNVKPILEKTPE